ncbi:ROK family protein [Streptomyces sp. NPDC052127]|uniref:ROK family protein n=1 Tax=Streptomyces sp. NPDC052127 TaxID=3155679 RepID=UPI00343F1FC7
MENRFTVGIDVGGTKTAAVLISSTNKILAEITEPTNRSASPEQSAEHSEALIDRLLAEAQHARQSLEAVGVGLPGLIMPDRTFRDSIILPTWQNVDFQSLLQRRLGVPVVVDNDTTMAALGHLASILPGERPYCLVCLTLGTGVGGAVLLNGIPLRGIDGTAGQIGHMTVNPAGRNCACGSSGCLNSYASGTAITARYAELRAAGSPLDTAPEATEKRADFRESLNMGDPQAHQALAEATTALIVAISNIVNVLNPELVVLGGGVAGLGSTLIDPVQREVSRRAFPAPARRVRVCTASHGSLTGALGAAVTAAGLVSTKQPTNNSSN